MTTLYECSRCHSEMLEEYFSINRKGIRNKCCKVCLNRYQCDRCDYACSTKSTMNTHIKQVHDKIKDHKCGRCDYKCSTKGDLNQHIKQVHDKIKDHKCNQCDFKCSAKGQLKEHIKQVHNKIKDFECTQCHYKCSFNKTLNQHIKMVHNKIKDILCSQCDYTCSTNSHLKQHIKQVHDKIKDKKCLQCDYNCSTKGDLNLHIKTCTGKLKCSSGEYEIIKLFNALDLERYIDYIYDESYWNVKDKKLLQWDFILNHKHDNPLVIEYDGSAHYLPVRFGGISEERAQENLKTAQRHDKIKDDYCRENNIPMLRIPYWEKKNIEKLVINFIAQNA